MFIQSIQHGPCLFHIDREWRSQLHSSGMGATRSRVAGASRTHLDSCLYFLKEVKKKSSTGKGMFLLPLETQLRLREWHFMVAE